MFDDVVLKGPATVDLVLSDTYCHRTYSIGLVDGAGKVHRGGGAAVLVPVVPVPEEGGLEGAGVGAESGVCRATPLSRLNVSEGMATPLAQAEYERLYEALTGDRSGRKPVHAALAIHWARGFALAVASARASSPS